MLYGVRVLFLLMLLFATAPAAETLRGVEYSRPGGQPLLFDAQIPDGAGPFPAAILVHGGGWIRGDRRTEMEPLFQPLTRARIAWFSIDYRLAKDPISFGVAIRDVEAAVEFLVEHAAEYNIDPAHIALVGESAGGHLAAMAALKPDLPVKTVVALYAPTNLASLFQNVGLIPDAVRENINSGFWGNIIVARLSQLSPVDHLHRNMPPFLLIHGTHDPLVPFQQSRDMCARMKALGNTCEVYPVDGGGHGMRQWKSAAYQNEIVRWLNSHL
jgi:acetyl esterase